MINLFDEKGEEFLDNSSLANALRLTKIGSPNLFSGLMTLHHLISKDYDFDLEIKVAVSGNVHKGINLDISAPKIPDLKSFSNLPESEQLSDVEIEFIQKCINELVETHTPEYQRAILRFAELVKDKTEAIFPLINVLMDGQPLPSPTLGRKTHTFYYSQFLNDNIPKPH